VVAWLVVVVLLAAVDDLLVLVVLVVLPVELYLASEPPSPTDELTDELLEQCTTSRPATKARGEARRIQVRVIGTSSSLTA
jgi:hypothetical protein